MSRLLVLVVLLLATALSGTADASLRAVGTGPHVVICADGAAVAVALGADGQPVEPGADRRHCPDCLPLVAGAAPGPLPARVARPQAGHTQAPWPQAFPPRAPELSGLPSPRGPPSVDMS